MGLSYSKNVAEATVDALTSVGTAIIANTTVESSQTQGVIITGSGDAGVRVGSITQKQDLTLHVSELMKAMSTTTAQQALVQSMNQMAKSLTSGINLAQASEAQNDMKEAMRSTMEISTKIANICSTGGNQTQTLTISGNVQAGNIDQEEVSSVFATCATNAIANTSTIQALQQKLTQSASATSSGISEWAIVAIVAIVVLGIAIPVALEGKVIVKYAYIFFILAGLIMIAVYFAYQPGPTILLTKYSLGLDTSSGCGPSGPVVSTAYKSPFDAGDACLANKDYVAFDWKGFDLSTNDGNQGAPLVPPQTTFYTSMLDPKCTIVTDPLINLFRRPIFNSGAVGNSVPPNAAGDKEGDYYLNTSNWQGYKYVDGQGWDADKVWPVPSKYNSYIFNFGQAPASTSTANTIWADISNPKVISVYVPSATTSGWDLLATVDGPGYAIIQTLDANTSGIKVPKTSTLWLLYVGGAFIGMGLITMVISLAYNPSAKNNSNVALATKK
jgi:hypothetical protein